MLIAVVFSIAILAVVDRYLRAGRLELCQVRARYELFALRDRLRREALAHQIEFDPWFKYMDTTLTRAIDAVHEVNLWKALAYFIVYARVERVERAYELLEDALKQRPRLKVIHDEYAKLLWRLIEDRHSLVRNVPKYVFAAGRVFSFFDVVFSWLRKSKRHALDGLLAAPETSTLLEYVPVHRSAV